MIKMFFSSLILLAISQSVFANQDKGSDQIGLKPAEPPFEHQGFNCYLNFTNHESQSIKPKLYLCRRYITTEEGRRAPAEYALVQTRKNGMINFLRVWSPTPQHPNRGLQFASEAKLFGHNLIVARASSEDILSLVKINLRTLTIETEVRMTSDVKWITFVDRYSDGETLLVRVDKEVTGPVPHFRWFLQRQSIETLKAIWEFPLLTQLFRVEEFLHPNELLITHGGLNIVIDKYTGHTLFDPREMHLHFQTPFKVVDNEIYLFFRRTHPTQGQYALQSIAKAELTPNGYKIVWQTILEQTWDDSTYLYYQPFKRGSQLVLRSRKRTCNDMHYTHGIFLTEFEINTENGEYIITQEKERAGGKCTESFYNGSYPW